MNKMRVLGIAVVVLVASLAVAGLASAQDITPPAWFGGQGMGGWMHGGAGSYGMGMGARQAIGLAGGPMHDYMHAALASALGLTRDDFEARLADGETPWSIAEAKGLTTDEFAALMTGARAQALAGAVADGAMTQEQADWMLSHQMGAGMMGAGRGQGDNWEECPMHTSQGYGARRNAP